MRLRNGQGCKLKLVSAKRNFLDSQGDLVEVSRFVKRIRAPRVHCLVERFVCTERGRRIVSIVAGTGFLSGATGFPLLTYLRRTSLRIPPLLYTSLNSA